MNWNYKLEAETYRRYIRHYIQRIRNGESRMNLIWEAKQYVWKVYRHAWHCYLNNVRTPA